MSIGLALVNYLADFFGTNISNYCQLETATGKGTMITREGGLVSFFEIKGMFGTPGSTSFNEQLESLTDSLSSSLSKPGHRLQFVFRRDPMNSHKAIENSIEGSRRTMRRIGLDLEELLEERSDLLSQKTILETCILVVTTYPTALHKDILKDSQKSRGDKAKQANGLKPGKYGQSPLVEMPGLDMLHTGFMTQIVSRLRETLSVTQLKNSQAMLALRKQIASMDTSDDWAPLLPDDEGAKAPLPVRAQMENTAPGDISHLLWPDISHQLFHRDPVPLESDPTLVDMGDWIIAPLMMSHRPQKIKPFQSLFASIDRDIPWQMSLDIESGHDKIVKSIGGKSSFASFVAFASSENRLIKEAAESLLNRAATETMVTARLTFSTWGNSVDQARRNRSKLRSFIEAWGPTQVVEERGDSVEAWLNTLPGFSGKVLSTPIPMTVEEVITMAPLSRPVAPWANGSIIYRTIDEKAFPYLPGSSQQNANMEIGFAPPGMGKSFYLAAANLALILRPGNEVLPRIGIIDIGYSSYHFVKMIQDALPPKKKHLAEAFSMSMNPSQAVNFFDTPLGCQRPLLTDREFILNMMILLCTPAGETKAISRLSELSSNLVDEMYDYFSEEGSPNIYEPGLCPEVDEAIAAAGLAIGENVSWWKIVKMLSAKEYYTEANLAQRYAVPTLSDATTVLSQSTAIKDVFGNAYVDGTSERLIDFMKMMLISACKDYPVLALPTVFSLGEARIVSIDLMDVAKEGSSQASKKTAIMYMLARNLVAGSFYRNLDTLREIPEEFHGYHRPILEKDQSVLRKLCMDEFHRTAGSPSVRKQAITDIREGRKYDVAVSLFSQMLDDFDPAMIQLANNIMIFSSGSSESGLREILDVFAPTPDAVKMMRRHLTGPGKEGSSMLYIAQLKGESNLQLVLRLTLGPREIWAYSTTRKDVALRTKLTQRVGLSNALKILGLKYKNGSALADIETMQAKNSEELDAIDESTTIYDIIVEKLIKEFADEIDQSKLPVAH